MADTARLAPAHKKWECPYAAHGKCVLFTGIRGDEYVTFCRTHVCQGQTGCPNSIQPPGDVERPYCEREECSKWGGEMSFIPPIDLPPDKWYAVLELLDEHDLVYVRDISWYMRLTVDELLRRRGFDVQLLAKTWTGAARSAGRMREAIATRRETSQAFLAAMMANNVPAMAVVYDAKWKLPKMPDKVHSVVRYNSVAVLDYVMSNGYDMWMADFRDLAAVANAAVSADKPEVLQYLVERHGWTWKNVDRRDMYLFHRAVFQGKLKAADWLRKNGYPVDTPNTRLMCFRLGSHGTEQANTTLKWLHDGVETKLMPCDGTCEWYRAHHMP